MAVPAPSGFLSVPRNRPYLLCGSGRDDPLIRSRPLDGFDYHRYALAASDAEGGEAVLLLTLLKLVE